MTKCIYMLEIHLKQSINCWLTVVLTADSENGFQDFVNPYKNCTAKHYSFLVIDTTPASDNTLHFRKNLLGRISKLIMTIDDKIRDKNCNMILTLRPQKYQHHYQGKLINMNILRVKKYCLLVRVKQYNKFTYSP